MKDISGLLETVQSGTNRYDASAGNRYNRYNPLRGVPVGRTGSSGVPDRPNFCTNASAREATGVGIESQIGAIVIWRIIAKLHQRMVGQAVQFVLLAVFTSCATDRVAAA